MNFNNGRINHKILTSHYLNVNFERSKYCKQISLTSLRILNDECTMNVPSRYYLEYLSPGVFILNKLDLTRFHLFLGDRTPRATLGCIFLFSIPIQFQVSKKFTSVWLILYESWVITCENWLILTWRFGQTRLIFIHWNGIIASISNPYKFSSIDHIIFG